MHYNAGTIMQKLAEVGAHTDAFLDPLTRKIAEVRESKGRRVNLTGHCKKSKDRFSSSGLTNKDYVPPRSVYKEGRPLLFIPREYIKDVLNFVGYVADTAKRSFKITMKNKLTGEGFVTFKPYLHRWTDTYRRGILAKFYALESYFGNDVFDVEFITITVNQRNLTYEEVLQRLVDGRSKLIEVLRWHYDTQDYVWMLEPHDSGFCHLHLVYFHKIPDADKLNLQRLWSEKYELADVHGVHFSAPRPSADGACLGGSIHNVRNYLMKYVSKGLFSESLHEYEISGRKVTFNMSLGELLFNSILKKTGTRLWGASRHLSKVMKRPERENSEDWQCEEVDQYYGLDSDDLELYGDETLEEKQKHLYSVLWTREGGKYPKEVPIWQFLAYHHINFFTPSDWTLPDYKFEIDPPTGVVTLYKREFISSELI